MMKYDIPAWKLLNHRKKDVPHMTKEDFSRAYRAAMGWEAAVVHDAELPI